MKILSTCFHSEFPAWTMPQWCAEEVVEAFPDIEFVRLTSAERIPDEIVDADVLMTWMVNEEAFRFSAQTQVDPHRDGGPDLHLDSSRR